MAKSEKITGGGTPMQPMVSNFSAIDKSVLDNIVSSRESETSHNGYVKWGDGNGYPNYLHDLYMSVPTLKSAIDGTIDFVSGDKVKSREAGLSDRDARKLVRHMAKDMLIYGGVALNVLRSYAGNISKCEPMDLRKLRSDKKNETFFYSEEFGDKVSSWGFARGKYIKAEKFNKRSSQVNSVYYYKGEADGVYPVPRYAAAVIAAEVEKKLAEFQLNSIDNGFSSNFIISFNNGTPVDKVKAEIERNIYEKFCGSENASRPLITYSADKDHAVEVAKLDADNFADRYAAASKKARQDIFTAFRANPNLFGIPTENLGFSSEEFASAFSLYNKTAVEPLQQTIKDILFDIYQREILEIEPFTISFE